LLRSLKVSIHFRFNGFGRSRLAVKRGIECGRYC